MDALFEKIMARIEKSRSGCWLWQGALGWNGYGIVTLSGRNYRCGRVVLQHITRNAGRGRDACHRCPNRNCVNPKHLYWGTRSENMIDKIRAGNGNTQRLSASQVREMRRLYRQGGVSIAAVGRKFSLSKSGAYHAIRGKNWKHV